MLERLLHGFGYALGFLLFFRAETPPAIVRRLRFAYRLVGVRITKTSRLDGVERTIFLCPYRDLGANRFGRKWLCHEKLDRVDDGYVSYLAKYRDITYRRPTGCEQAEHCADEYCYSEVVADNE